MDGYRDGDLMESKLVSLKELTAQLPIIKKSWGFMERTIYNLKGGTAIGIALLDEPEVSVGDYHCEPNVEWPRHGHPMREAIGVVSGSGRIVMNGDSRDLEAGDMIIVEPGVPHKFECHTAMRMIGITIPAEEGYPSGG